MARKKVVDSQKLVKAVEEGKSATEIMEKFGLSSRNQLKSLYLDALIEAGKAKGITSHAPRENEDGEKSRLIKVNKRGSLVIPRASVELLGFCVGDIFNVRKTKSGISLRKL